MQGMYVDAFLKSRSAEEQEGTGDLKNALKAFRSAADTLTKIKQQSPRWQSEMVDFRLKRTMDSIARVQGKMGGEKETGGVLPPLNPADGIGDPPELKSVDMLPPLEPVTGKGKKPSKPIKLSGPDEAASGDPFGQARKQMAGMEMQIEELKTKLDTATEKLKTEQQQNQQITKQIGEALEAQKKAQTEAKTAKDLLELNQKNVVELKNKGETNVEKSKATEAELAEAKKKNAASQAELAAAEERINQLLERSRAISAKVGDSAVMPGQIKQLEGKLEAEQKAKADVTGKFAAVAQERDAAKLEIAHLQDVNKQTDKQIKQLESKQEAEQKAKADVTGKLAAVTQERDAAKMEITRLQEVNKQTDKLMSDNATLLKKLGDAEKQIVAFRTEGPKKDVQIAELTKQVTDAQKALAASQQQTTTLQTEVGELHKKVDDYTKQIQQAKVDKTANVEDRRKMEEENKMLQGIVMRVLQEDANRSQRKKMIQKEMDHLQIQSDVLLKQIGFLTQPVVKLSSEERRLFKRPVLDVQDPNTLVAIKTDGANLPAADATLPPLPKTEEKPPVADSAKLDKPPLPTKEATPPETTDIKTAPPQGGPNVSTSTGVRGLSAEVKPIAEQAKSAFEREKFGDAEKLYDKALQLTPNNLYLRSNIAVTQFRMGKLKQAEENFRKAIAIAPEDHFCWSTLGIVYYSQNKYDEAVNALTKSLAINPKNPTAHNYLGITAAQKGWVEAAQKELETALQLDPKYADAWFNLAVTQTLKQPPNKEEGRKAYKKAIELGAEADPAMEATLK